MLPAAFNIVNKEMITGRVVILSTEIHSSAKLTRLGFAEICPDWLFNDPSYALPKIG